MTELRLGVSSDWHLAREALAETVRVARHVTEGMVEAGVTRALLAGDICHEKNPAPDVWAALAYCLEPLFEADVRVDLCAGTHDCLALGAEHSAASAFAMLLSPEARWHGLTRMAAHNVAELQTGPADLNVLWLPHAVSGRFAAAYPEGTADQTTDGIKAALRGLVSLPPPDDGRPSIIVGHWSPCGAALSGNPKMAGDLPGEVTVDPNDVHPRYAALILGHVHKPQEWSFGDLSVPWIVPGSVEQRTWGEEGEAKSWCLLSIGADGTKVERIPTGCRERMTYRVTPDDLTDWGAPGYTLADQVREGGLVRVVVEHREGQAWSAPEVRQALGLGPDVVIEGKVTERREVVRDTAMSQTNGLLENLDESLTENPPEPPEIAREVMGLGAELVQEVTS